MDELQHAVTSYLGDLRSQLDSRIDAKPGAVPFPAVPSAARQWFEETEATAQWAQLVDVCARTFSTEGHGKSQEMWRGALHHWFRRSGTYLKSLQGAPVDPGEITKLLTTDIRAPEERITFLVLLGGVSFAKKLLEFGTYDIAKPDAAELEMLLEIATNRVFYPHALMSTERLTDHWYLRTRATRSKRKVGRIYFQDPFSRPIRPTYSQFDPAVELALKRLVLWDWRPQYLGAPHNEFTANEPWQGFSIPFVITVNDDLFHRPPPAPPVEGLYYEPVFAADGEEIGEQPVHPFEYDAGCTDEFEIFLRYVDSQLGYATGLPDLLPSLELALSYLIKAFLSDGLEQMLWHVVILDALLGDKPPGATDRLLRRLGNVYSGDDARNHAARTACRELYTLRSELVHGRPFRRETDQGDLRLARTVARVTTLQVLKLVAELARAVDDNKLKFVPNREEVLQILDLGSRSMARTGELLQQVERIMRPVADSSPRQLPRG